MENDSMNEFFMKDITLSIVNIRGSFQTYGIREGYPSVIIETFGDNLKNTGYGLDDPTEKNPEIQNVTKKLDKFKNFVDCLPKLKTGLPNYYTSLRQFGKFSSDVPVKELKTLIDVSAGIGDKNLQNYDLVFDGGEPLLTIKQKQISSFIQVEKDYVNSFSALVFNTNGTQKLTEEFKNTLLDLVDIPVFFNVCPRLSNSGEPKNKTLIPSALDSIVDFLEEFVEKEINIPNNSSISISYIVDSRESILEAVESTKIILPDAEPYVLDLIPYSTDNLQEIRKTAFDLGMNLSQPIMTRRNGV